MTTVYRAQEGNLSWSPEFIPGGIGIRASLHW
jgi:hypothetical protein